MDRQQNIYNIFDTLAQQYGPPFTAPNNAVAHRAFLNLLKDVPEDMLAEYQLNLIGQYDPDTGLISGNNFVTQVTHTPKEAHDE